MRIGIDCRTILNPNGGEQAGVGHYTYYLVKSLLKIDRDNQYVLFFDSRFKNTRSFKRDNVEIRFFPFYQYKKYLPITYSQMLVSAVLARENLDIFHSPANIIPLTYNRPSVITVHDLAIYKNPDLFPKKFLDRQIFATRVLVPSSLSKSKKIIAVSENTKQDIVDLFNVQSEKIEVVYEGVVSHGKHCPNQSNFEDMKRKYGIGDKYILFLGTIEPRKNIPGLVKAFRNLKLVNNSPLADYQLVIAGSSGWKDKPVYDLISEANRDIVGREENRQGRERRNGIDRRNKKQKAVEGERRESVERRDGEVIKHIGYVSHADKLSLICNATCFAFPSLYEGFGLPVLEAMSMGTPVITSRVSSLPEVVGRKGAILIDPNSESEIVDALTQMMTDDGLREELSIRGQARAKEFNWLNCAAKTLNIYRESK